MARIEIISSFTGEMIGYFGDSKEEKKYLDRIFQEIDIKQVIKKDDVTTVYASAFKLPEIA